MKNYQETGSIELVFSGSNYFAVLEELIANARVSVEFHTYIFENDATGKRIVSALKNAGRRGVRVFVLADAFGSNSFPSGAVKELQDAGIHFRFFSPLFSGEGISFGRRLHHKIVVADGNKALVGGINIADKYNALQQQIPWLDYAVLLEGKICGQQDVLCKRLYARKTGLLLRRKEPRRISEARNSQVRFRRNDWLLGINEIHQSYFEAIIGAEKSITLVASYFLPGRALRKLLCDAASRGVEIKIILAGKSDVPVIYQAEKYLYNFYLNNRIQIFHWNESVLHGKAMTVDGQWATIGSYNLNYLSHYLSIELNVDIKDKAFAGVFDSHLRQIIEKCMPVRAEDLRKQESFLGKMKMRLGYVTYKLLMNVMLSKRKNKFERNRK
jgi:cardiolipin synthase